MDAALTTLVRIHSGREELLGNLQRLTLLVSSADMEVSNQVGRQLRFLQTATLGGVNSLEALRAEVSHVLVTLTELCTTAAGRPDHMKQGILRSAGAHFHVFRLLQVR